MTAEEVDNVDFKKKENKKILRLGHCWKFKTLNLKSFLLVLIKKSVYRDFRSYENFLNSMMERESSPCTILDLLWLPRHT